MSSLFDFKYASAGLYAFASTVTIVRLFVRLRNKQWWWDDSLALVSMLAMPLLVAGASLLIDAVGRGLVAGYYLAGIGYYTTVWSARISIIFTVVRIAPGSRERKILIGSAWFFVLEWLVLIIQIFWVCEITSTEWKRTEGGLCILGNAVAVTEVLTSVISDLILIFSPLWIIRKVQLTPSLRFRLLSAFFISIATTVAALIHAILVIRNPGPWEAIFGAVEAGVSMTVCNASVIIPLVARVFSSSDAYNESDRGIVTIGGGGSGAKHRSDITRLSNMHGNGIRVEVAVDQDVTVWESDQKRHTGASVDVERESCEGPRTPSSTKDVGLFEHA